MKDLSRRVWLMALASVVTFAIFETVKTLLFPGISLIGSHVITVAVVGILSFFVSRYALRRYNVALHEIELQTVVTTETNRLLSAVLTSLQEGVVIVNSNLDIILYNNAAARMIRVPEGPGNGSAQATEPGSEQPQDQAIGGAANGSAKLLAVSKNAVQSGAAEGRSALLRPGLQAALGRLEPRRPFRLTHATRDPAINAAFRRALEERAVVEERVEIAGRQSRTYQFNVAPLDIGLAVGVFFDITELERLEKVRREFFSNLSHELRTPLTAILAFAETLLAGAIDDRENNLRFLETIHRHAIRMTELISDISDLSAIESGEVTLQLEPVNLREAVAEVIALLEVRAAARQVTFETWIAEDVFVLADRRRLSQILHNLIDNAIKFNRQQGKVMITATPSQQSALSPQPYPDLAPGAQTSPALTAHGTISLRVEDTGTGIPSSDLSRIFERLYRADKSRSRRVEGTGLGLAIVKHLVQSHQGEIKATSELGRGSKFTFTIPAAPPFASPSPSTLVSTNPSSPLKASRTKTDDTGSSITNS